MNFPEDFVNKIIHADCLEVMKSMPDKCVDLVLTDPPYGMSYQSSWRTATPQYEKIQGDDDLKWFPDFSGELFRIMKENTHGYLFCNDYSVGDFRKYLSESGFSVKRILIWLKNNHTSGDLEGDYANKTEFILFVHKGRKELSGGRDTNILSYSRSLNDLHPTQKPVDMLEYLLSKSSGEDDIIFDPFAGSCTTAVACTNLKRKFICIEKEESYVKVCNDRMNSLTQAMF